MPKIFILLSLFLTLDVFAQNISVDSCLDKLSEKKITEEKFFQSKSVKGLTRPIKSRGLVTMSEEKISWKITEPFRSTITVSEEGFYIDNDDDESGTKENFNSDYFKEFGKTLLTIHKGGYSLERKKYLEERFFIKCETSKISEHTMTLIPRDESLKKIILNIVISSDGLRKLIQIEDGRGDKTTIEIG